MAPGIAIVTAGYRNRYRLPAAEVVAAYRARGAQVLVTGETGHISLVIDPGTGSGKPTLFRTQAVDYWRHAMSEKADGN